jgi:hypothetical protein
MNMKVPCELIVWYILPAIRREFARVLVQDFNLDQKEAAKKLGLTEAAISQYFKSKRGKEMRFSHDMINEIKKACKEIFKSQEKSLVIKETCMVCDFIKHADFFCKLHKTHDIGLENCNICREMEAKP